VTSSTLSLKVVLGTGPSRSDGGVWSRRDYSAYARWCPGQLKQGLADGPATGPTQVWSDPDDSSRGDSGQVVGRLVGLAIGFAGQPPPPLDRPLRSLGHLRREVLRVVVPAVPLGMVFESSSTMAPADRVLPHFPGTPESVAGHGDPMLAGRIFWLTLRISAHSTWLFLFLGVTANPERRSPVSERAFRFVSGGSRCVEARTCGNNTSAGGEGGSGPANSGHKGLRVLRKE